MAHSHGHHQSTKANREPLPTNLLGSNYPMSQNTRQQLPADYLGANGRFFINGVTTPKDSQCRPTIFHSQVNYLHTL